MPTPYWRIVLHGGCANTCPDIGRQQDIEHSLNSIAEHAASALKEGAKAKEVVLQVVTELEDCVLFNAGKGSALTRDGVYELEAGIVDGHTGSYGAVGCVAITKNPILAANALLEQGPHCMLVGEAADDFSRKLGLETVANSYFTTPYRRAYWELQSGPKTENIVDDLGTVGAIVLDSYGSLVAGGSTGGINGKLRGRIGDTAVLGAGLYADDRIGIVCSGAGDQILQQLLATKVAKYHASGLSLNKATHRAVSDISGSGGPCAVAAITTEGEMSIESTARLFYTASASSDSPPQACIRPTTFPLLPQHIIYNDNRVVAGLTRFPTTTGHTLVISSQSAIDLFSLQADDFTKIMVTVSKIAANLRAFYHVRRCALVTEGGSSLSIIPLHGLSKEWQPVTSDSNEFHERFPGYISSMDGPKMNDTRLDGICSKIREVSGISPPFNYSFEGDQSDNNLFARIVRGELPEWRIWEDDKHVAFLTPFANTPGFTVLVPRTHLASDIFSLEEEAYIELVAAAHIVGRILKEAFGVCRCGLIFEGFEIDYAHVKMIPIHDAKDSFVTHSASSPIGQAAYEEKYQGHVTSLQGPLFKDFESLANNALSLRKSFRYLPLRPPQSWKSSATHTMTVLQEPWYSNLLVMQDALFHASVDFFKNSLGYKYALVPATTDSISSPMGLGSDSLPVSISLLGKETHLADLMQFSLEYFLRIEDDLPGVYYINTSFRGEDSDQMHLNQFYHAECELLGNFSAGLSIAEKYIINLLSTLLRDHHDLIQSTAGSCDHLRAIMELHRSNGEKFPQVTLDDALKLPEMDDNTWEYVVPSEPQKGRTINRRGELKLIQHFGGIVWLTEMDHLSVPFYQAYTDDKHTKGRCADLLLGYGEVLGLGERHMLTSDVKAALHQHEVPPESYSWYMDIRDIRPILTSGWGMGTERFLAWVFQHNDIRDMSIIPRMKGFSFAP